MVNKKRGRIRSPRGTSLWYLLLIAGLVAIFSFSNSSRGFVIGMAVLLPCSVFALVHDWIRMVNRFTIELFGAFAAYWLTEVALEVVSGHDLIDPLALCTIGFVGTFTLAITVCLVDNRARRRGATS